MLKIERIEYVNKTFRIDKKLLERMDAVCDEKNISLNRLTAICIEYALDNLEQDTPSNDTK